MENILEQLVNTMPYYQASFPMDVCIVICDTEKVYGYLPGEKIDLKLEVGKSLDYYSESAAAKALKEKRRIQKEIGEEFLGVPYIVTATPIFQSGELIGSISVCSSNEEIERMRKNTAKLNELLEQMSYSLDDIVISSNENAKYSAEISEESNVILEDLEKIDKILLSLQKNAMQAKILGLNAAIEAAKSKEQNSGFIVVANEIKKMSEQSEQFSKEITQYLKEISNSVEVFHQSMKKISSFTEEHLANVQYLRDALDEIKRMSAEFSKNDREKQ